ncbi:hypothetical protein EBS80_04540 [bacterium]|nr:hypothetical protein [bacterium]
MCYRIRMIETYRPRPEDREPAREQTVRRLADEAMKLRPKFTSLTGAAWQAIRNARVSQNEQRTMHAAIMSELGKRSRGEQRRRRSEDAQLAEAYAILEKEKRAAAMAQAYRHEKSQPPDAYESGAKHHARRGV